VWTPGGATRSATFTVLAGEISGLPISLEGEGYSWILNSPVVTVELTCAPYGLGTRVLYGTTTTNSTPLQTLELPSIPGDVPALGELIVTDLATQSRRHVEWGIEGPLTYNNATSLLVDSDDMVTSGFSGAGAVTAGAYDPNAAGNNSITLTLVAGATTALCGTGNLGHVGVFRVKARVYSASLQNQFRLSWKTGDGPVNHNAWVLPVSTAFFVELDLGTITVPATISGTQRWTGQVEVLAAASSPGTAIIDYMILVPQADGYGVARAVYSYSAGVVTGYDAFVGTTAGVALNTRTAPLGGSWATSGDATDFVFDDSGVLIDTTESIRRTTSVAETSGRFAILGATSYTDTQVDARGGLGTANYNKELSLIARWTDSSNYVRLVIPAGGLGADVVKLEQVVAGVVTTLASYTWNQFNYLTYYRFRLIPYASGRILGWVFNDAGSTLVSLDASSSAIATGGTLASGKPGVRDRCLSGAGFREFTEVAVSTPAAEPIAINSSRTIQFRYDDTIRDDSVGTVASRRLAGTTWPRWMGHGHRPTAAAAMTCPTGTEFYVKPSPSARVAYSVSTEGDAAGSTSGSAS
jgi:hypothetical protein